MGAHADDSNAGSEGEPVLASSYKQVPIPTLTTQSACELLLKKSQEQAAAGRTKWLTNSVTEETLNFADVEPLSRVAASAMAKRGMSKGDVALYLTMDVTKIYTTILGVWRVGGIMYSSYPEDTSETLLRRLEQANARWVFCDPISVAQVKAAVKAVSWEVEIIVFGDAEGCTSIDEIYQDDGTACPAKITTKLDDPLLILCTSGTTGMSKGAIYTNKCILAFCLGTAGVPRSEKPALMLLRCTHVLGCLFLLRNINQGSWCVMMSQITKLNIFKAVDTYKPNMVFGFPTFVQLLTTPEAQAYDRSSIEIIITGGVQLTQAYYDVMMTLPNVRHVMNGFGMTECGAITTTIDLSGTNGYQAIPNVPILSVGRLYPNTAIKIFDLDTGRALGPNQRGEIAVKSPIACAGYWKQPEDTKTTFLDGWLRTGDLGYYDHDGFIYVVDRIKETFKYFNNHISPAELEAKIMNHPAVAETTCFGLHDPEGGDIPRALVVLKPQAQVSAQEIQDFVDAQVATYQQLRGGLYIVPQLPRGKTGKISRMMASTMPVCV